MSFRELLAPHARGDALERLVGYAALLDRWSRTHNLVRYADRRELVGTHLLASLADGGPAGASGVLLDVGSGAGLPAVPRLCVAGGWRGVLVEPRQKRWAFLRLAVRELDLDAEVVRCRFQELGDVGGPADEITARAVGDHVELLGWARDRLAPGGGVLLWLGEARRRELAEPPGWRVVSSRPLGRSGGRVVRYEPCFT